MSKKTEEAVIVWLSVGEDARANPAHAQFIAYVLRCYLGGILEKAPGFDAEASKNLQLVAETAADLIQTLAAALEVQATHAIPKKPKKAPAPSSAEVKSAAEVRALLRLRKLKGRR